MSGWTWCLIGLVLIFLELALPSGFYLFLLGVSAVVVGGIALLGIVPGLTEQLLLFSFVAIVTCFCLARKLQQSLKGRKPMTAKAVGKTVKVTELIVPGAVGNGDLWGSTWRVRNVGDENLDQASEALVVEVEGLTLHAKRR
jgi:membrane protein implicated in regulation of membrane protease activity